MHHSQIPEKPLVAGVSNRVEPAQRIFFFERNDGKVIAVQENEAWSLYSKRQQLLTKGFNRVEFKLIGTGDGRIFQEAALKAKEIGKTNIEEAQKVLREGQEAELEACRGNIIPPRNTDELK